MIKNPSNLRLILIFSLAVTAAMPSPVKARNSSFLVSDCFGRRVTVPEKINRIVCLYAFSGHVAVMLGKGEQIVAVSNGLKRDTLLHKICPSILDAVVPKYKGAINIEELVKTSPDLAFISGDIGRNKGETAKLDAFNIPYLVVDYHSIQGQQFAIDMIAKALHVPERGTRYLDYYNRCLDRVHQHIRDIPPDSRIRIFHSVLEPTRTDPKQCLTTEWINRSGGVSVSAAQPLQFLDGKSYAAMEQILLWNPDVILVNEPSSRSFILKDIRWSAMAAVKNKKVFQMPIGISRWGHPGSIETPLAILWTAATLYPDRFGHLDMRAEIRTYYQRFFAIDLKDKKLDQILSGSKMRKRKNPPNRKP